MKKFKFTIQGNKYDVNVVNVEDNIAEIEVNGATYKVEVDKVIAQRSIAIIDTLVSNNYIKTVLQSPFIQHQLKNTSSTAQGGVYLGTINELVIPMPPLSEQKRIVAEIKEILPYTNKLVK